MICGWSHRQTKLQNRVDTIFVPKAGNSRYGGIILTSVRTANEVDTFFEGEDCSVPKGCLLHARPTLRTAPPGTSADSPGKLLFSGLIDPEGIPHGF
jgi:hypothetical protein